MNRFGLCCQVPSEQSIYVVPSLLPPCKQEDVWPASDQDALASLYFIHTDAEWESANGFLPRSLFFALVAKFNTTTAEIESFKKINLDLQNYFLVRVLDVQEEVSKLVKPAKDASDEVKKAYNAEVKRLMKENVS